MGYAPTKDNYVYVVSWDEANIVKIGSTSRQRWRSFLIRGGRLVWLGIEGCTRHPDYPGETQFHRAAEQLADCPFETSAQAVPYLGSGGGGYLECYRVAGPAESFWKACTDSVLEQHARALPPRIKPRIILRSYTSTCHERDGRDALTEMSSPNAESSSNASRAGGPKDSLVSAHSRVSA